MNDLPKTKHYLSERDKLPENLRSQYDSLVKWYRFLAQKHHNRPFVSYMILADLIREGWRLSEDAIED